jgi:hypothetical protein
MARIALHFTTLPDLLHSLENAQAGGRLAPSPPQIPEENTNFDPSKLKVKEVTDF